jgi:hypothetical protein
MLTRHREFLTPIALLATLAVAGSGASDRFDI